MKGNLGTLSALAMILSTFMVSIFLGFRLLPNKLTYEFLFLPCTIVGYSSLGILIYAMVKRGERIQAVRIMVITLLIWVVANIIDLQLIYFEAWTFNPERHGIEIPLFEKTFYGNKMHIPLMEIFGFNMIIAWIILFLFFQIFSFVYNAIIVVNPNERSVNEFIMLIDKNGDDYLKCKEIVNYRKDKNDLILFQTIKFPKNLWRSLDPRGWVCKLKLLWIEGRTIEL